MLATPAPSVEQIPRGPGWAYEVKWDGVRVLADTTQGDLRLVSRSGREVTVAYPELGGLTEVQGAVLDGEVVAMSGGRPSFEALAERMHVREAGQAATLARRAPVTFVVFDVLTLYGVDLTRRGFTDRRATLERLTLPPRCDLSPVYPDVDDLWAVTREHGLEGVVAKRRTSTYQPGRRSPDWVKVAHRSVRTAVVVGWRAEGVGHGTRPPGEGVTPGRLGSLLLAAPDRDGAWRYLGRAGSGLAGRRGQDVALALVGLERPQPALDGIPEVDRRGTTWCEPAVTVDVSYLHRTRIGRLRHPVVRGLRQDTEVDPWEDA
ncbi:DNA ligase [Actinotalea sp. K2]|uniref:ATP-dependent DNA ligase n=1 Tax=Actinotalea sp. K2 TaxID=2939438 RepID=UPI0024B55A58|nr:DNA ligase [Actinotalea sp. K2]